jgi:hypothetical protein
MAATALLGGTQLQCRVKILALDLLWDPVGVCSLVEHWLATYVDRLHTPMPHSTFCSLLTAIVDLYCSRPAGSGCQLELVGYTTVRARELGLTLHLFEKLKGCAINGAYFKRAGRHRTAEALSQILNYTWQGQPAFLNRNKDDSIRGDLRLNEFMQNEVLRQMVECRVLLVAAVYVFMLALKKMPLLWEDSVSLSQLFLLPISNCLWELAARDMDEEMQQLCADLAVLFEQYCGNVPGLIARICEIADLWFLQMRNEWGPVEIAATRKLFNSTQRQAPRAEYPSVVAEHSPLESAGAHAADRQPSAQPAETDSSAMDLDT